MLLYNNLDPRRGCLLIGQVFLSPFELNFPHRMGRGEFVSSAKSESEEAVHIISEGESLILVEVKLFGRKGVRRE